MRCASLVAAIGVVTTGTASAQVAPPCEPLLHHANLTIPELQRFALGPATAFAPACGMVELTPTWSPFGLAMSVTGHVYHDMTILVQGLPDTVIGGSAVTYVAWLATPNMDRVERIGEVRNREPLTMRVDFNKVMIVITGEQAAAPPQDQWSGPIALVGRSRSALMQSLMGHSIFNRAVF